MKTVTIDVSPWACETINREAGERGVSPQVLIEAIVEGYAGFKNNLVGLDLDPYIHGYCGAAKALARQPQEGEQ